MTPSNDGFCCDSGEGETCVQERFAEPPTKVGTRSAAAECLVQQRADLIVEGAWREAGMRSRKVQLMKDDDTARFHATQKGAEDGGCIGWIHQNVAAHYGVELARGRELVKVANLEPDPRGAALLGCATAGLLESGGIAVDAKYASAGTYDICDEKCHVPYAGADV